MERPIAMTDDVLSLTDLRANLTEKIDGLAMGSGCLVVTRNGRAAAIILSPEQYDRLQYQNLVRAKIARALDDVAAGRTRGHQEVMRDARRAVGRGPKKKR